MLKLVCDNLTSFWFLSQLQHLRVLELKQTRSSIMHFKSHLIVEPSPLEELGLYGFSVHAQERIFQPLRVLRLDKCNIEGEFSSVLMSMTKLENLSLWGSSFRVELNDVLPKLTTLRVLSLGALAAPNDELLVSISK